MSATNDLSAATSTTIDHHEGFTGKKKEGTVCSYTGSCVFGVSSQFLCFSVPTELGSVCMYR